MPLAIPVGLTIGHHTCVLMCCCYYHSVSLVQWLTHPPQVQEPVRQRQTPNTTIVCPHPYAMKITYETCLLLFLQCREKPDIVFLQEVVPHTCQYLEDLLPHYLFLMGNTDEYFTATLLQRTTVHFDGQTVVPFANTSMGRNLLCVEVGVISSVVKLQQADTFSDILLSLLASIFFIR